MSDPKRFLPRLIAVLFALALWHAASVLLDQSLLLVSPIDVIRRLGTLCLEKGFIQTVALSTGRILFGFALAFVLGIGLAILAGRSPIVEVFLWPFVVVIKSVPVASFIIISLIWLSAAQLSGFISFLMVFPIIYSNLLEGIKSTDPKLLEMAQVYSVPWGRRLTMIVLPHIRPFLYSACSVALGLGWKAGIAAEVIGIPEGSIGEALYESKVYFNTADLFAWTVVIVIVCVLFEKVFMRLLRFGFDRLEKRTWILK